MTSKPTVAYFSAEYSVADSLPIYAGGLGILAGDAVQQAGLDNRDFHAIGLVYHQAFTGSDPDSRPLTERLMLEGFEIIVNEIGEEIMVSAPVSDRVVRAQAWRKKFGTAELLLLDTNVELNSESDRKITNYLYDADQDVKIAQQLVLGFGGIDLLAKLNISPSVYHLNEGHMSFAGLAVAAAHQHANPELSFKEALAAVKGKIVATKHTILSGAGITLSRDQLSSAMGSHIASCNGTIDDVMELGGKPDGYFSTTRLMLGLAGKSSGVAKIHVAAEAEAHPGSPLIAITNGVYEPRWRATNWSKNPLELSDATLWHEHNHNRQRLLLHVAAETGAELDPDILTVVWARRMTAYKRPELLVEDLDRLKALADLADKPVQFIVSGKANPADTVGLDLMNRIIAASKLPELEGHFAYLPHYNPASARMLVQGADLWLNTPIRGMEACGTSGMKASLNGALQFSTSDGWIDEIDIPKIGWRLADKDYAESLYHTLEWEIAPLFYDRTETIPTKWVAKMRNNIELIEKQFTSKRMLDDYYAKLYT